MRRVRLAAPVTVLALVLAGCGGARVTVEEVPGGPVQLTTPGKTTAFDPTPTATATAGATPTATTTGTGTTAQPQATPTQAASGTTGGGTAAPNDSASSDQPPPAGSDAQRFEEFCAQNPGAC